MNATTTGDEVKSLERLIRFINGQPKIIRWPLAIIAAVVSEIMMIFFIGAPLIGVAEKVVERFPARKNLVVGTALMVLFISGYVLIILVSKI